MDLTTQPMSTVPTAATTLLTGFVTGSFRC